MKKSSSARVRLDHSFFSLQAQDFSLKIVVFKDVKYFQTSSYLPMYVFEILNNLDISHFVMQGVKSKNNKHFSYRENCSRSKWDFSVNKMLCPFFVRPSAVIFPPLPVCFRSGEFFQIYLINATTFSRTFQCISILFDVYLWIDIWKGRV